jgi:PEP-CTERM motif
MKLIQVFGLSVLVLFIASGALADGVSTDDVRIIVGGDPAPGSCKTMGLGTFMVNPQGDAGGGTFTNCFNKSGENWIGLEITGKTKVKNDTIKFGSGVPFACNGEHHNTELGDLFTTCTIISRPDSHSVMFDLTGGIIAAGSSFLIDLSDAGDKKGGKGGWEGQLEITPLTVAAPEPGALALLLMGLGATWFWRSRKALNTRA